MAAPQPIDRTKSILADLVAFPSVSSDSNRDIIAYLADGLRAAGAAVEVYPDATGKKANVFATLGPKGDGGIVLSGHTDVVPVDGQEWQTEPFAMVESHGRLFGRGTCDMKGFIAAALVMAPSFATLPLRRPLHFAFTYDEEVGCFGAHALLDVLRQARLRPSVAIIGEPTEMRIIDGHKGCYEYTTSFRGVEAHSSLPETGVSAVEYAVRFIVRLLELRDSLKQNALPSSRFEPPYSTMHVGRIMGGTARNIVAQHCHVDWEIRPMQREDADNVKAAMAAFIEETLRPEMIRAHPATDIATQTICEVDGLEPVPHSEARELITELTGANSTDVVPFGTEAGLYQRAGISSIICGPGSIAQAHKADEFVETDQLLGCLTMLERLQTKLI